MYGDLISKKITDNKNKPRPYELYTRLLKSALERKFVHVDKYYHSLYKKTVVEYYREFNNKEIDYSNVEIPVIESNSAEDNFQKSLDELSSYYPEYSLKEDNLGFRNGRTTNDIKYSGRSKIIAIIVLKGKMVGEYDIVYGGVSEELKNRLWKEGSFGVNPNEQVTSDRSEVH